MSDNTPAASLAEIRELLSVLPAAAPDGRVSPNATGRTDPPAGPLGLLGGLRHWLAAWQARSAPRVDRPRLTVFLGCSDADPDVAAARRMVAAYRDGSAPAAKLCAHHDAELRLHELALGAAPEADDAGLSDPVCATAMAYGMMAVDEGVDLLCVSAAGPGVDAAAVALCMALYGGAWAGEGQRGSPDTAVEADPLTALRRHGGHALSAVAGAVIAARMGRVPVILDGIAATAAAAVLHRMDASVLDHCLVAHLSPAAGHRRLLDLLEKAPLLDLGIATNDGSGALIALGVVRGAVACDDGADEKTAR